jgi:hypothetical protein
MWVTILRGVGFALQTYQERAPVVDITCTAYHGDPPLERGAHKFPITLALPKLPGVYVARAPLVGKPSDTVVVALFVNGQLQFT